MYLSRRVGLPFGKRHLARLRCRILELQRWREKRGLKFNLHPKFWRSRQKPPTALPSPWR
jgi:hypothetical protein